MFDDFGNRPAQAPPPTTPTRVVRFDKSYIQTAPGILKIVQIVCNSVGFICIKISSQFLSAILYNLLYWVGNVVSLLLLLMYLFHLVEKYGHWAWHKFESCFCMGIAVFYISCSIFATTINEGVGYAVGFFGFCAVIAYGMDGYLKFRSWRRGLPPQ